MLKCEYIKKVFYLIFYRSDGCIETWDLKNDWYQDKVSLLFKII